MKIAVVGAGVAGIAAAWLLSPTNEVDVYEAGSYLGGHALTVDVSVSGATFPVDSGFMVFNRRTYPNLIRFFDRLGVEAWDNDMAFSVRVADEDIEWSGRTYNSVFAQRRNVANPRFLSMIRDVLRLERESERLLADPSAADLTLGELLAREGYGDAFISWYLIPMGSSIWSTPPGEMLDYPALTFLRFCDNHGLLRVQGKPTWMSLVGGSRTYVEAAAAGFSGHVFLSEPVESVERRVDGVHLETAERAALYDAVVIATHPPQTLGMLADASDLERSILGQFAYNPSSVVIHTDTSFMPKSHRAWASWNYFAATSDDDSDNLSLTYYLNRLQKLPVDTPVLETLNRDHEVAEGHTLDRLQFEHPMFTRGAIDAQRALGEIQGDGGVYFAGAWTRYGFHEDGMLSGVRVAELLGAQLPWGDELDASRTRVLDPTPAEVAAGVAAFAAEPEPGA